MQNKAFKNYSSISRQSGFSLMEIAIVTMISGFIMVAGTQFVKLYTINSQYETTLVNLKASKDALMEFRALYGRYPCPADPTIDPAGVDRDKYGIEQCRTSAFLTSNPDDCTGKPGNVECTTAFSRDGDLNLSNDVVMIGILPFRTLANDIVDVDFNESNRLDGYSIHLSYAVTENMTNRKYSAFLPVNTNTGAIRVEDENQISLISPDDSAHYVVFSHGDNKRGGYTTAAQMVDDCMVSSSGASPPPPALPVPGPSGAGIDVEIENCENNDAIFVKGIRSLADNSSYNDDLLVFTAKGLTSLWNRSLASPAGESYIYNTNLGNVGIGTDNPTHDLHVIGDLSAQISTIAISYCDGIGTDCLIPEAIAGTGSKCADPTQVAYAIQNNEIVCRDVNWTLPTAGCPSIDVGSPAVPTPSFIRGFSNQGALWCCVKADVDGSNCVEVAP